MKQTKIFAMVLMAAALLTTSCASKKDLQNCQTENRELTANYQDTKEKLAATEASLAAAQQQLATAKSDYAKLQSALDKSLTNANQNNISIEKLVDQINESNQYIRHLVEVKSKSDSLNMVLTNNLTRSLSREEMKEVDVQVLKGVVYISLADNMLYQSGSYEVNDRAKIPLKELANYSISLSSLTGGRASFTTKFASYELVPTDIQSKLIAEHEAELAKEAE